MKRSLYQELILINPEIVSLDSQPILNNNTIEVGWNCFFMNKNGEAIAGGTAPTIDLAKRIAVAECFERSIFNRLFDSKDVVANLLLDESPSTSGFAAGFDRNKTVYRSICEAIEWWAWSKIESILNCVIRKILM